MSSFSYVIEKYQKLALNIALPIVKSQEDAEEVVQDAFVKIYRFIHQYNGESRFSSWLYKIVYNTALTRMNTNAKQWIRDQDVKQELLNLGDTDELNSSLDAPIKAELLEQAMGQLSDSDRLLVTLHYFGEKSLSEIAEITDWKTSKCKVKLMRARQKLKEILYHRRDDLL